VPTSRGSGRPPASLSCPPISTRSRWSTVPSSSAAFDAEHLHPDRLVAVGDPSVCGRWPCCRPHWPVWPVGPVGIACRRAGHREHIGPVPTSSTTTTPLLAFLRRTASVRPPPRAVSWMLASATAGGRAARACRTRSANSACTLGFARRLGPRRGDRQLGFIASSRPSLPWPSMSLRPITVPPPSARDTTPWPPC